MNSNSTIALDTPLATAQIAQYQALHMAIDARVTAVFTIWNQLRSENGPCDEWWDTVHDWSVDDDQVSVKVKVDKWTDTDWNFPITLLCVKEDELTTAVEAAFLESRAAHL